MRRIIGVAAMLMLFSLPVLCQDYPKAEVFGGYQYTRINPGGGFSGDNFNGWNAALTGNVNHWLGVTADFSGAYKDISGFSLKQHTFLFGPTIASHSSERFTPFAHALFGGARSSSSVFGFSASETAFAMALGGGVDIGSRNLAFRIGQFDYLMTRFGGVRHSGVRRESCFALEGSFCLGQRRPEMATVAPQVRHSEAVILSEGARPSRRIPAMSVLPSGPKAFS